MPNAKRSVMSRHMIRRRAIVARDGFKRLQARAVEEGGTWPPTDEPERQALYEAHATPESRIEVKPEKHWRYKWAVVAIDSLIGVGPAPEKRV